MATLDAVFASPPQEAKAKKEKKQKKKSQDDPDKAARRAAREAKALEAAQRSVGAIPAPAVQDGSQVPPTPLDPHEVASPVAAASPPVVGVAVNGNSVQNQNEEKRLEDASPIESSASGGIASSGEGRRVDGGDGKGGDSDEEFFGPFATKKPPSSALKPAASALFEETPEAEEKVGVNFDEDLSLGGTAITRIAGLAGAPKRTASVKNLQLLAGRSGANSNVTDAERTRVGELELEEGKVIKSWKKVKAVLKNNKLVVRE